MHRNFHTIIFSEISQIINFVKLLLLQLVIPIYCSHELIVIGARENVKILWHKNYRMYGIITQVKILINFMNLHFLKLVFVARSAKINHVCTNYT